MTEPRIGDLAPEWQVGRCMYALDERSLACLRDAKWHGVAADFRGMECCDEHKPIMEALAQWVHDLEPACSLPMARFVEAENRCVVPWDDAALATIAADHVEVGDSS